MGRVNGLRKGQQFERVVAKLLGQAICGDDRAFIRMPLAGRAMERYEGDIIQNPDPFLAEGVRKTAGLFLQKFMLDAKDRKGWSLEAMILNDTCPVWDWWDKLARDAHNISKVPLLVVKYAGKVWGCMEFGQRLTWLKSVSRSVEVTGRSRLLLFPWDEMNNFDKTKLEGGNGAV